MVCQRMNKYLGSRPPYLYYNTLDLSRVISNPSVTQRLRCRRRLAVIQMQVTTFNLIMCKS